MKYSKLSLVCVLVLTMSQGVMAKELQAKKQHKRLSPQADAASQLSRQLETEQLEKARQAVQATQDREREVLKRQQSGEWQEQQRAKAQQHFNDRQRRQEQYLREAAEAAEKERKIPKPFKE